MDRDHIGRNQLHDMFGHLAVVLFRVMVRTRDDIMFYNPYGSSLYFVGNGVSIYGATRHNTRNLFKMVTTVLYAFIYSNMRAW